MNNPTNLITIDGSRGEGGGQVLRTALTLSLITGRPLRMINIRAKRKKPGLMRQHLTAVQAAAAIGAAEIEGAGAGSQSLLFHPQAINGGDYRFAIGTAGSCTLVLQTVLPALLAAGVEARLHLSGGTHNPMAPPADFLQHAYLPLLRRMGADIEMSLSRYGFYPAGGGELELRLEAGSQLQPLHLSERGELRRASTEALIAALPVHIAERELETVRRTMGWDESQLQLHGLNNSQGPGNALVATIEHEHVTEVFTAFGEKGISAEKVAGKLCRQIKEYLQREAPVGPHLADQLLLPLAIGGGDFITAKPTQHTLTNMETINAFVPGCLDREETADGMTRLRSTSVRVSSVPGRAT
ncbi:MAG: RNA 3'-terminal phosphate cyclase [Candidatus Thiodiazotropha sp.]|jgi:RNA 3'-terminal phosphate cyclase (ATP)